MRLDPTEEARLLSRDPPRALTHREARVGLHIPNVLRVPCDPLARDPNRWFRKLEYSSGKEAQVSRGNQVTYLIDGPQTFRAMVDAIETATGPDHFIYLLGWFLGDKFPLIPEVEGTKISVLFESANKRHVRIRAMLWDNPITYQNEDEVDHINALEFGRAILDRRHLRPQRELMALKERRPLAAGLTFVGHLPSPHDLVHEAQIYLGAGSPQELQNYSASKHIGSGSHHQKILIINGTQGVISFCGGIDINPDRLDESGQNYNKGSGMTMGSPLHDVHCRIRGPAAADLLRTFVERWKDHPANGEFYSSDGAHADFEDSIRNIRFLDMHQTQQLERFDAKWRVRSPEELSFRELDQPAQLVQVGRTYGDGSSVKHGGVWDATPASFQSPSRALDAVTSQVQPVRTRPYRFAPKGEWTVRDIILHAIGQAERFIYIEDQYLTPMPDVIESLKKALKTIHHLTVLIPDDTVTQLAPFGPVLPLKNYLPERLVGESHLLTNHARARRQDAIRQLKQDHPEKVRVFTLIPSEGKHTYVHAKMFIIDDEFAIIGSANCNRRSYTHDSEVVAAIADQPHAHAFGYGFAHRLRIALWAEHLFRADFEHPLDGVLGKRAERYYAELADGVASAAHWLVRPVGAKVAPYDENAPADTSGFKLLWDREIDPDGS